MTTLLRPTAPAARADVVTATFAVAALVAAVVTVFHPLSVSVLGLAIFGVAHVLLEVRYVVGRFSTQLTTVYGLLLAALLTLVVLGRAVAGFAPGPGRYIEIIVAFAALGTGAWVGLRGWPRQLGLAAIVVAALISLLWPTWYLHVITHLHNLVPLVFLWDWSTRIRSRPRRWAFRGVQLAWAFVVPAVLLSGALDRIIPRAPELAGRFVGDGAMVVAAAAPPGADPNLAWRYMVVFAFLQTMHYVTWIWFFPTYGRSATRAFESRFPRLAGWTFWAFLVGATVGLFLTFNSSWTGGRTIYSLIAVYHVYLEFPILLLVLVGAARAGRPAAL